MYDYAPDGQLYLEVFVQNFVKTLLEKWKALQATHSLTVVLFTRTVFLSRVDPALARDGLHHRAINLANPGGGGGSAVAVGTEMGCAYEDAYKVVVENETTSDAGRLMRLLKREIMAFPRLMGWCRPQPGRRPRPSAQRQQRQRRGGGGGSDSGSSGGNDDGGGSKPCWLPQPRGPDQVIGVPSFAAQGNFLEAINVTLNVLEKHYMDRDLTRSGNSIVTVSASSGVFEVDPMLAGITKQRMMDNGIGMDMVSLSQPPLHTAPLFIHRTAGGGGEPAFEVPHWMNLSFAATPDD
ncbi:unnamed protein product, partial [Phaeothamnion confervicola]